METVHRENNDALEEVSRISSVGVRWHLRNLISAVAGEAAVEEMSLAGTEDDRVLLGGVPHFLPVEKYPLQPTFLERGLVGTASVVADSQNMILGPAKHN